MYGQMNIEFPAKVIYLDTHITVFILSGWMVAPVCVMNIC